MSKAIGKVSIIINKGLSFHVINLLRVWHCSQQLWMKWGGIVSQPFKTTCGVGQGGVLSPYLFNIYMDSLSGGLNRI